MSFIQDKQTGVGELLGGAFSEIAGIRKELAIYFAVFAALAFVPNWFFGIGFLVPLVALVGYFVAQYMLYRAMLERAGMLQDGGWRVIEFGVMAIVLIIPISIGLNLFFIPGLILIGKWIMAPTFLVARRQNLIESIGDSWRASDNNTVQLTLAATVICTIWIISFSVMAALDDLSGLLFAESLFWLWIHVLPVLLGGLSVAAYKQLSDETASLTEVFS